MPPRCISRDEVRRLLPFETCLKLMREAIIAVSEGRMDPPARQIPLLSGSVGVFGVMPSVRARRMYEALRSEDTQ